MHPQHRILIVDNNPADVVILRDILNADYQLITVASGAEALSMVNDVTPALILLNMMTPEMDGEETYQRLRAMASLRYTKILKVADRSVVCERTQRGEIETDDYLAKPFNKDELRAKVNLSLRLKASEEVNQLKTDFLALMNHRACTPLHGILLPVQVLRTDNDLGLAERNLYLDIIEHSADRLRELCHQVSILSEMKAGRWPFAFVERDLHTVISDAIERHTPLAVASDVTVEKTCQEKVLIVADAEQMTIALAAILENAIQYSPAGGKVAVALQRSDHHAAIAVHDQGSGIAPEALPSIFEAFSPAATKQSADGYGLSLAITQQIVWAHRGTIAVESAKDEGTTFTVRLPLGSPRQEAHAGLTASSG